MCWGPLLHTILPALSPHWLAYNTICYLLKEKCQKIYLESHEIYWTYSHHRRISLDVFRLNMKQIFCPKQPLNCTDVSSSKLAMSQVECVLSVSVHVLVWQLRVNSKTQQEFLLFLLFSSRVCTFMESCSQRTFFSLKFVTHMKASLPDLTLPSTFVSICIRLHPYIHFMCHCFPSKICFVFSLNTL